MRRLVLQKSESSSYKPLETKLDYHFGQNSTTISKRSVWRNRFCSTLCGKSFATMNLEKPKTKTQILNQQRYIQEKLKQQHYGKSVCSSLDLQIGEHQIPGKITRINKNFIKVKVTHVSASKTYVESVLSLRDFTLF